jgi:hypothetical protein
MTRETLVAARWLGPSTGDTYRALFDANDVDDALRLRKVQRAPEFKAVTVEIDFDPAQSPALNRPARELVEVERDRLAGLLREARALLSNEIGSVPDQYSRLVDRIDAALPQQQSGAAA